MNTEGLRISLCSIKILLHICEFSRKKRVDFDNGLLERSESWLKNGVIEDSGHSGAFIRMTSPKSRATLVEREVTWEADWTLVKGH